MDLAEYWQENRRFVLTVAAGLVAFLAGLYAVDSVYGSELLGARRAAASYRRDLQKPAYDRAALDVAREDNAALREALEELSSAVAFEPREGFRLRAEGGSARSQFHLIVGRVRDELLPAAARVDLRLEKTLGLPKLSPTRDGEIERHLAALDVIDRVARRAIAHRVERMEDLSIVLDPGLRSREGVGRVERTKVEVSLRGPAVALLGVFADLQRQGPSPVLVERFEMTPSRSSPEDAELDLVLLVLRLHEPEPEEAV